MSNHKRTIDHLADAQARARPLADQLQAAIYSVRHVEREPLAAIELLLNDIERIKRELIKAKEQWTQ